MNMKFLILLLATNLLCCQLFCGEKLLDSRKVPVRYAGKFSAAPVWLPEYRQKTHEFRGVWVATVENLDFPAHRDAAGFKRDYLAIVNDLAKANFNAVIFQIRPCGDAFYPSRLTSWSQFLAGTDGVGIKGFDPLKFMVAEAHKRGLEFHAWMNPYRVIGHTPLAKEAYLRKLSKGNFARRHPELVLCIPQPDRQNLLLFNPGEPAVIGHIVAVVREVVANYNVDAIHFDDYFYPYDGMRDQDTVTYRRFGRGAKLDEWRRNNVTAAIRAVRKMLDGHYKTTGRKVRFGISPFGIWANRSALAAGSLTGGMQSYSRQYADTRLWVKCGYIDYVVPQLYWNFSHDTAAYAALADWWSDTVRDTPVRLIIGHAVSRIGSGREWSAAELPNQLRFNCTRREIAGSAFFSYRHVFRSQNKVRRAGIGHVLGRFWTRKAKMPWAKGK